MCFFSSFQFKNHPMLKILIFHELQFKITYYQEEFSIIFTLFLFHLPFKPFFNEICTKHFFFQGKSTERGRLHPVW